MQEIMNHEKTLYLVDGSGFIFRAYYGIRAPMSAKDGTYECRLRIHSPGTTSLATTPSHLAVTFDPKALL